jgi:hypothetical protein
MKTRGLLLACKYIGEFGHVRGFWPFTLPGGFALRRKDPYEGKGIHVHSSLGALSRSLRCCTHVFKELWEWLS